MVGINFEAFANEMRYISPDTISDEARERLSSFKRGMM